MDAGEAGAAHSPESQSHRQLPDNGDPSLPLVPPPLNPAGRLSAASALAKDQHQRRPLAVSNDLRSLRTESKESDLFADLSTTHRELDGYLNRDSAGLLGLSRKSSLSHDIDAESLYTISRLSDSPSAPPSIRSRANSAHFPSADYSTNPYSDCLSDSDSTVGSNTESPSTSDTKSSPSAPPSPRLSSYHDSMFATMTVDAAAAALISSSSDDLTPPASPLSTPKCSPSRLRHSRNANAGRDGQQKQLENLLLSTSNVGKVCLVSPRAGPFEGQFVALITTVAVLAQNNDHIALIQDSEFENGKKQIHTLKTAVAEWGSDSRRPDVWVMLRSMATNAKGEPDARKLQTWVQNLGEEMEGKIMSMQLFRHRRTGRAGLVVRRSVVVDDRNGKASSPRPVRPDSLVQPLRNNELLHENVNGNTGGEQLDHVENLSQEDYFPLSVMQQLFFRALMNQGPGATSASAQDYRFSQSILLHVKQAIELADIEAAFTVLVSRHSMLRARFRLSDQGWAQIIAPESNRAYRFEHRYMENDADLLACVEEAQRSIDIFTGPVFAVKHIRNAQNKQLLYLVAHHLVVDLKSWHIILHDLDELLREGTLLSEPSMPFTYWTDYQSYENSQRLIHPILPFEVGPENLGFWGLSDQPNLYGDTKHVTFMLPEAAAFSLRKTCNNVFRTESADVFLAALLQSFERTFPERKIPTIWKQEHGRDPRGDAFNIDQTVGWFTALCPINVNLDASSDIVHLIKVIKDTRKSLPRQGTPFFQSRFAADNTPATSIPVEIMFNCVETLDELQRENGILAPIAAPDREIRSLASDVGPGVGRIALFEVSVGVDDHGARVEFFYNVNSRHQDRIATWMNAFKRCTLEAISRLAVMKPELTLSDVPLLETSYEGLSKLTSKRLAGVGIDNIETAFSTLPMQQEILIAQTQDPNCFHISRTYELMTQDGSLVDQARLCAAWETLVSAHRIMRSIFVDSVSDNHLFDQVVLKKISPAMLFIDSEDPMETLSTLPPMKSSLSQPRHRLSVSRSERNTFLRVDCSQALCDQTGIHNLVMQLRRLYMDKGVVVLGDPAPVTPRQNRHIASLDSPRSVDIWRAHLDGATSCILPLLTIQDQDRHESRGISLDISRYQLSSFCSENSLNTSTVIQLAWAFVLRTYVGEDRVVFGYQHTQRDEILLPDRSQHVGSLASIVPCLVDFSPMSTVLDVLCQLDKLSRESRNTTLPTMAEIEHSLGIQGQRLFNTCVTCQDVYDSVVTESDSLDTSGWEPILLSNISDNNCDLSLCVTLRDDCIQADVSYACLSSEQLHNVMNTFQRALQIIIHTPGQPVSQADLFTEHDFQQIMSPDWESDRTDTKISACVHKLILRQCRARPYSPAIYAWDGDLSYQQVETSVSKLATYLGNLGVGPGVLVPIVLEKSRWSPVIMLAVMQAGGCFVCLDAQDMAMVEAIIHQLEPHLVVVTEGAWKHVSQFIRNCVLVNETFLSSLLPQAMVSEKEPLPEQAACAFLTPGSQRPKGVFFTHQSLCSILSVQGPALQIHNGSRVLQLSAYTVDVALVEILGTMLHGGCVCIPSALERVNDLEGTIARMDITWTYMTTVLSRKINPANVPNLQTICFRTRTLDNDTFTPWLGARRNILLAYGSPDVCALAISVFKINKESDTSIIAPPMLGRFLILNPEDPKKLMPLGAVGELAIDSPIITPHKYVYGSPLVDPIMFESSNTPRKWRYLRTGHRVRFLSGGHIRFLGTMRDEAMVNGSPALAAVLEKQIRQCLGGDVDVAVEPIVTNETMSSLAAFLEFGDGEFVGPSELDRLTLQMRSKLAAAKWLTETFLAQVYKRRKRAASSLLSPSVSESASQAASLSHCVPTLFIPVRRFPLSTSLKINRRKLQKLVAPFSYTDLLDLPNVPFSSQPYFTGIESKPLPLTKTEESMRLIWAAVLHAMVADIRPQDSFLDVGGNTLLAERLVLSCRQNGFDVSIKDVLSGATLTELCKSLGSGEEDHHRRHHRRSANLMKGKLSPKPVVTAHKLPEGADHGFVKLIVAPQLDVPWNDVSDVIEASSHQVYCLESCLYGPRSDVRCVVVKLNGALERKRVQNACDALTRLHPSLRTAFVVHDCHLFQVVVDSFGADFDYKSASASSLDKDAQLVVKRYQKEALQLRKPATKFAFLDAETQGGRLIVRFSSAQVSESAVPRLVQDLVKLYEHPDTVPQRTTFFDYTRALRGARQDDSRIYWKRRLDKAKMTLIVPQSKPLAPVTEIKTVKQQVVISPLILDEFGIRIDSVLKAAWAIVLATLSGTADVVFGEVVEGRRLKLETSVDVSSIVGPMENVVPVRVRFPIVNSSPLQILRMINNESQDSLPYEAMGARKIVQQCTNWAGWTRFSTVVRHRSQIPVDGTTTLNIENATFTYKLVQPQVRDAPDMFAHSTMLSPSKMSLAIEYSPDRVPEHFAQAVMVLLAASVETLGCYETISQPILQPSSDYESLQPRVLVEKPASSDVPQPSYTEWLTAEQRNNLQQFLVTTWNEVLRPEGQALPESELISARFYDISGSIIPAYLFAERLNASIRKVEIEGIHTVHVTAFELVTTPTITGQMALITRKMHAAGVLSKPGRKKPIISLHAGLSSNKGSGNHSGQNNGCLIGADNSNNNNNNRSSSSNWAILAKTKGLRRFRHSSSHGSMRDLSNKASFWVKSRVNLSKEKSPSIAGSMVRQDATGWEVLIRDGPGTKASRGIATVPETAVEIGPSAVVVHRNQTAHPHQGGDVSPLSGQSPKDCLKAEQEGEESGSISSRSLNGERT
ncbi:NRPS protein [Claviceps lovelessii]|nr:NRPS protein [Claviceps lovelessii]